MPLFVVVTVHVLLLSSSFKVLPLEVPNFFVLERVNVEAADGVLEIVYVAVVTVLEIPPLIAMALTVVVDDIVSALV